MCEYLRVLYLTNILDTCSSTYANFQLGALFSVSNYNTMKAIRMLYDFFIVCAI